MTSSGTACAPLSREGVALGPACARLWSWDDVHSGGLTVGRLGRFSSSSFQVVGEVLLGQLSAPDVYM